MSWKTHELNVIQWAEARGIVQNATPQSQLLKAVSEIGELVDALNKHNMDEIKDAVGDIQVCLINFCAVLGIDMTDCLGRAYNEIKDRKGYLTKDGTFIKDR